MSVAWVGAGIAAVGVASSVASSKAQSKAAGKAADASTAASSSATDEQMKMYNQTRTDQAPWRISGGNAVNKLSDLLGITSGADYQLAQDQYIAKVKELMPDISENWVPSDSAIQGWIKDHPDQFTTPQSAEYGSLLKNFTSEDLNADPVYQSGLRFGLDEGTKGINRQAAAGGNYLSGAALKALTRYGNDYGSAKAAQSYDRYNMNSNNTFNKLSSLAGLGQSAANTTASTGANTANQIGNYAISNGANQGNAALSAGNARGSAYSGLGRALGSVDWTKLNDSPSGAITSPLYGENTNWIPAYSSSNPSGW